MKKLLTFAAAMMVAVGAYAQGQVNFANFVPTASPPINAPVFDIDGTTALAGANFRAQLFAGPAGAGMDSLTPVGDSVAFVQQGFWAPVGRTIDGIFGGQTASLQVRAWDNTTGATFGEASAFGFSDVLQITLGGTPQQGAPLPPTNLDGLGSFSLVPEPTTIALGLLGGLALLFRRRK